MTIRRCPSLAIAGTAFGLLALAASCVLPWVLGSSKVNVAGAADTHDRLSPAQQAHLLDRLEREVSVGRLPESPALCGILYRLEAGQADEALLHRLDAAAERAVPTARRPEAAPGDVADLLTAGNRLYEQALFGQAAERYRAALALNPAEAEVRNRLAMAEIRLRRPLAAAMHLMILRRSHPDHGAAAVNLETALALARRPRS